MPKANLGCYSCTQRRITCDQTRPKCNKCLRKGINCPGYGVRYRFNEGIASRGKLTGCRVPIYIDEDPVANRDVQSVSMPSLLWPDGSATFAKATKECVFEAPVSNKNQSSPDAIGQQERCESRSATNQLPVQEYQPIYKGVRCVVERTSPVLHNHSVLLNPDRDNVPRPIVLIDWPTQKLFAYFSRVIASNMVVLDGKFNGYRDLLLPLAHGDDLVKAAVCVVSQYHLSSSHPELQTRADQGLQLIIKKLHQRALLKGDLLDLPAWATVIILLTGETATGNNNFPFLFKILQHLGHANMQTDMESVLHTFLAEQTKMMTLFAQPLLDESSGVMTLHTRPERYFDFITNAAIFNPAFQPQIQMYKSAIYHACNIYLIRATQGPPHSQTVTDVEALRVLCEQIDPNTPGHHVLVWVYFIAAAESSTFAHRNFFTLRLQEIFSRTRFHNIPAALSALQDLWKMQDDRKWTETLPEVMPVFII